jgi:phosphoglycolate phosphatase
MSEMPDIEPEEVVYCGDSDVDMITGHNAGVRTIGVCWGFRGRDELESCNPWLVVETPSEICEAIIKKA